MYDYYKNINFFVVRNQNSKITFNVLKVFGLLAGIILKVVNFFIVVDLRWNGIVFMYTLVRALKKKKIVSQKLYLKKYYNNYCKDPQYLKFIKGNGLNKAMSIIYEDVSEITYPFIFNYLEFEDGNIMSIKKFNVYNSTFKIILYEKNIKKSWKKRK